MKGYVMISGDNKVRVTALALKTTAAYRDWLQDIADRESLSLSRLVRRLIEDWARVKGFAPPPPLPGKRDRKS